MTSSLIVDHQLFYEQDTRTPLTSVTIAFLGGGLQQETDATAGLARITAKMLFRGTSRHDRESLARAFEILGADVSATVTETEFFITLSGFSRNIDQLFDLLLEVLNDVQFPEKELELVKQQQLNAMEASLQEPERVLMQAHSFALFGGGRMGKIGSRSAIRSVTRAQVIEYYQRVRSCATIYRTALTDLPEEEIRRRLDILTAHRTAPGFALRPEEPYAIAHGRQAIIVQSEDAANDRLLWSHTALAANDDRRYDLGLALDAFGSFEGYLFDVLRNKNGWCYSAFAFQMNATLRPGRVSYYSDPSKDFSAQLMPEMMRLIETFPEAEEFKERLVLRPTTFKNRYNYQLDPKYKLSAKLQRDLYGIPILSREEYCVRIDAVTLDSVRVVLTSVVDPKNMFMVFYGEGKRIEPILKSMDPSVTIRTMNKEDMIDP